MQWWCSSTAHPPPPPPSLLTPLCSFSTEKHESLCHTRLFPLERRSCGVAVVADEARDWKLQAQFSWKVHPVSRDYMRRRAAEEVAVIEREMLLSQTHGLGADSRPPRELIAYCIKNKLRSVCCGGRGCWLQQTARSLRRRWTSDAPRLASYRDTPNLPHTQHKLLPQLC